MKPYEDAEESTNYLDIWRDNPARKDISGMIPNVKLISFTAIIFFIGCSTLILTSNLYFSFGMIIFLGITCLVVFSNDFFFLERRFTKFLHKFTEIKPLENFRFYMLENDPSTVFILNKKDMITIATRIFRVEVLAENIKPTINQFLYAFNVSKIPYTYQVVQKPVIKSDDSSIHARKKSSQNRTQDKKLIDSYQTYIYFSVYCSEKGTLRVRKLDNLIHKINIFSRDLESNFSANFHHTKLSLLEMNNKASKNGEDEENVEDGLISGIRTLIYGETIEITQSHESQSPPRLKSLSFIFKCVFLGFIICLLSLILLQFKLPLIYILGVNLVIICLILFVWWRELLFFFTHLYLRRYTVFQIHPFSDVKFYKVNNIRDTLYIHINNVLLLGIKIFNLKNAVQTSFAMPDKFFRAMNNQKTPFVYTVNATPIESKEFKKKCAKQLNDKTKGELEGIVYYPILEEPTIWYKNPDAEYLNWVERRTGIWKTCMTVSTSSYKFTNAFKIEELREDFYDLEEALHYNATNMAKVFQQNFKKFFLTQLQNQKLISAFQSECFKNTVFRLNGTHLNQVYFQGKKLTESTNLANEFRKGVETRIAAEFNSPLYLENFITIGHTINTEFLEKEIPSGFTFKQLRQLLITNGTSLDREHLKMKIVTHLIKADIPSLVFDFTGDWSKLINYFKNTRYEDSFLYFKAGQSFNLNLINSGIKYDTSNLEYLNYFYDVFALAFKTQNSMIELLKRTIRENEKLDWRSIALDMVSKPDFEKNFYSENLLNLFQDFLDQTVFFSDKILEYENDIAPLDFIRTDKTVIIDLSGLRDLEQQSFATFVILAKFIHYMNYSQEYHRKMLFIPNIDIFFDEKYIDNNFTSINYGKIDKILAPLIQNGFGLVFSANQIRYLHPNVFNHLRNIITFQALDSRDIATLKNITHLQELHGTGYYSTKRNNTYQIQYLMTMRNHEVIVKRDDIFQPFPVEIDTKKIIKMLPCSDDQIYEYMKRQGYNLKQAEQKLLAKLEKTIFEKDFGIYYEFVEDVKNFLNSIKIVHNIGNLTERTLKEELLKYTSAIILKRTSNLKDRKKIRDEIFQILLKHGYLEENHPPSASGSQSIRTSYRVGDHYQKALDDEVKTKIAEAFNVDVEVIEGNKQYNPFNEMITEEHSSDVNFDDDVYRKELLDKTGDLILSSSQISAHYRRNEYEKMISNGKNLINIYFTNLFNAYNQGAGANKLKFDKIKQFVEYLAKNNKIPYTMNDLRNYIKESKEIFSNNSNVETRANRLNEMISEFCSKLWSYIDST
ncbi:MAG: hypothetical protein ACXACO_05805 [Promethearchaeota archaeon]|jgi:hypothetical protein